MIGKEALGIEHSTEQSLHPASTEQREELGIALSGDFPSGNEIGEFRAFPENPSEMFRKFREAVENSRMEDFDHEKRDKAHDGKNFNGLLAHLREAELIVIKFIGFVPKAKVIIPLAIDRAGDGKEVLKELGRRLFVGGIEQGELDSDAEHIHAIHCHPASSICLIDETARRKRTTPIKAPDII